MMRVMSVMTRAIELADVDAVTELDGGYAERRGVPPMVERAVVSFYARSGHSFVRDTDGLVDGFVLAHAVWDGARPTVRLARLVARDDASETLRGLLDAFVKSAYDAGVYDLVAELPSGDEAGRAALRDGTFSPRDVASFERVLGSRGAGSS
jgi:hypothetical protein